MRPSHARNDFIILVECGCSRSMTYMISVQFDITVIQFLQAVSFYHIYVGCLFPTFRVCLVSQSCTRLGGLILYKKMPVQKLVPWYEKL